MKWNVATSTETRPHVEGLEVEQHAALIIRAVGGLAASTCLVFTAVAAWKANTSMLAFFGGYALVYLGVLAALHRGQQRAAGWLLYSAIASGVTLLACLLGPGAMVEMMFLLLTAFPYYVVPVARRSTRLAINIVPIACIASLQWSAYGLIPSLQLASVPLNAVRWPLLLATFVAAALIFELSSRDRERSFAARTAVASARERASADENLRQVQKLESLRVLAGGVAHDFNNLLMGVLGNASFLVDEFEPGTPAAECVHEIETASQAAAELCRHMLAYAGRSQLSVGPLDLTKLVRDTTGLLSLSICKTAQLELRLSEQPLIINADPTGLRQIFMNLVMNASDALEPAGGAIQVHTSLVEADASLGARCYLQPKLRPGPYAHLEVTDNGHGMNPQTLARLFEPFYSTRSAGRGLGLSAVLGIIQAHQGGLEVVSKLGRGTSFRVYLPIHAGPIPKPSVLAPASELRLEGRVLVVDDDERVRATIERILIRMGLEVTLAVDGQAGLDALAAPEAAFALVVLDANMPRKRGLEVLEVLRVQHATLPVLFASGHDQDQAHLSFAADDYLAFLQKPFSAPQLRAAVTSLLGPSTATGGQGI